MVMSRKGLWFRHGLAIVVSAGCAKVLGFEDPVAVACVASSDCDDGFACFDGECRCAAGCEVGGQAGATNASAGDAQMGGAGTGSGGTAGDHSHGAGAGGDTSGNAGGGGKSDAGAAGTDHQSGSGGESGSAGAGGEPGCAADSTSCLPCETTGAGERRCEVSCRMKDERRECFVPPSCTDFDSDCREMARDADGELNCCLSLPLSGGSYDRACDYACRLCDDASEGYTGAVSAFALDAFEVTVRRFRRFVNAYESKPTPGSGKNPKNDADNGWNSAWDVRLPDTPEALREKLASSEYCPGGKATWTEDDPANDDLPMNCVDWYLAQAFCIWDGQGRLPTLLEWEFAAGGGEERVYPWSVPPDAASIDAFQAVYRPASGPEKVGSKFGGRGRFGHYDLAGNVTEWLWDGFEPCYQVQRCEDCGETNTAEKLQRGGSFADEPSDLLVETRFGSIGTVASPETGFRCARNIE